MAFNLPECECVCLLYSGSFKIFWLVREKLSLHFPHVWIILVLKCVCVRSHHRCFPYLDSHLNCILDVCVCVKRVSRVRPNKIFCACACALNLSFLEYIYIYIYSVFTACMFVFLDYPEILPTFTSGDACFKF